MTLGERLGKKITIVNATENTEHFRLDLYVIFSYVGPEICSKNECWRKLKENHNDSE